MIGGIKRRFVKSIEEDPWEIDQELEPELETDSEEASELQTDATIVPAGTVVAPPAPANDVNSGEYYKSLVRTAIQNGGKYGDHQIPIPWLRMILAGLEWRRVDPDMMWYGIDGSGQAGEPLPEIPAYDDLFPSDRDAPTGPGPR